MNVGTEYAALAAQFQTAQIPTQEGKPLALSEGDIFTAEVLDVGTDGKVTLRMPDGQRFLAELLTDRPLVPGQRMTLTVSSVRDGIPRVEISGEGTASADTFLKAAHAPKNDLTTALAREILHQRTPFTPKQFEALTRAAAAHPELEPEQAVFMARHRIPITPENIAQYRALSEPQSQLGALLQKLLDLLPDPPQQPTQLQQPAQQTAQPTSEQPIQAQQQPTAQPAPPPTDATAQTAPVPQQAQQPGTQQTTVQQQPQQPAAQQPIAQPVPAAQQSVPMPLPQNPAPAAPVYIPPTDAPAQTTPVPQAQQPSTQQTAVQTQQPAAQQPIPVPQPIVQQSASPQQPIAQPVPQQPQQPVQQFAAQQPAPQQPAAQQTEIPRLLDAIFTKVARGRALPREMDAPRQTREIGRMLARVVEAAQEMPEGTRSEVMKAARDIVENLRFSDQLNHCAAFAQLPLTLNGERTTAQLYVFNDSKEKKRIDPHNATVFVSLATANLGNVEGFIKVIGTGVDADFALQTEEAARLFRAGLPELNTMLELYGYRLERVNATAERPPDPSTPAKVEKGRAVRAERYRFNRTV
ncbi:MAG: flagellar hook-length control protein FliK [Oscillospiraceae bacterium]|nr:flagellar hook-length control protein FliK [Oscillospiraceae bacterium]